MARRANQLEKQLKAKMARAWDEKDKKARIARNRLIEKKRRRDEAIKLSKGPEARETYTVDEQFFVDQLINFHVNDDGELIVEILWLGLWKKDQVTYAYLTEVEVWSDSFLQLIQDTLTLWPGWLEQRKAQLARVGVMLMPNGTVVLVGDAKIEKEAAEMADDWAEEDDTLLEDPMALAAVREEEKAEILAEKRRQEAAEEETWRRSRGV